MKSCKLFSKELDRTGTILETFSKDDEHPSKRISINPLQNPPLPQNQLLIPPLSNVISKSHPLRITAIAETTFSVGKVAPAPAQAAGFGTISSRSFPLWYTAACCCRLLSWARFRPLDRRSVAAPKPQVRTSSCDCYCW